MAFTPENTVWTPVGQAIGCPESGVGCRGQSGVSPKMGGMAVRCAHQDCPVSHLIADAKLAMDEDRLRKLPSEI